MPTTDRSARSEARSEARLWGLWSAALSAPSSGAGIGALVGSSLPSEPSVVYQQPVAVGETLPDTYTYYAVPQYPDYQYIVLNNRRVIVDRHHRIVRVMP